MAIARMETTHGPTRPPFERLALAIGASYCPAAKMAKLAEVILVHVVDQCAACITPCVCLLQPVQWVHRLSICAHVYFDTTGELYASLVTDLHGATRSPIPYLSPSGLCLYTLCMHGAA